MTKLSSVLDNSGHVFFPAHILAEVTVVTGLNAWLPRDSQAYQVELFRRILELSPVELAVYGIEKDL